MSIFQKKSIGIDIADHTIEVAELIKSGRGTRAHSLGRIKLDSGIVRRGLIKDEEKLAQAVKEALGNAKPYPIEAKKVVFGLPERQVFTHVFLIKEEDFSDIEKISHEEIEKLVLEEAQTNIPLENEDLLFGYRILAKSKDNVRVLLVAVSRQAVLEWQRFFQKLEIEVEVFDIETLANFRDIFTKVPKKPVCLVDFGAATTNIAIFNKMGLQYSHAINIAGDALTKEIANILKVSKQKAESVKIEMGLSNPGEQVFTILVKVLGSILNEIKEVIDHYQENNNEEVKEIIFIGGSSQLKGVLDYFQDNFSIPVRIGESSMLKENVPIKYIEAVGLALRELDKKWSKRDLAIYIKTPKYKEKATKKQKVSEESDIRPSGQSRKLHFQKVLLAAIIVFGIIGISLAFWYQGYEKEKKEEQIKSQTEAYSLNQTIDLKILIATAEEELTPERAVGRIYEDIIKEEGSNYNELMNNSRVKAEQELKDGEELYKEPINKIAEDTKFALPISIKWLIYNEKDADMLFLQEIDKINKEKIPYLLDKIEKGSIEPTDNNNLFYLNGKVTISLDNFIKITDEIIKTVANNMGTTTEEEAIKETIKGQIPSVIIKETETGWLNVREGPGTYFQNVGRVNPGEKYPILDEQNDWVKIQLSNNEEGWVFSQYTDKINE